MIQGSLPYRYARALVELAEEANAVDKIADELAFFEEVARQTPGMIRLLSDIVVMKTDRRRVLSEILERMAASELFRKYAKYLLEKERFGYFTGIVRAYQELRDERTNRIRARVTSVAPLDAAITERLEKILADKTGKQVAVDYEQDPSLIGGLVIQMGSRIYDGSVNGELVRFQAKMLK